VDKASPSEGEDRTFESCRAQFWKDEGGGMKNEKDASIIRLHPSSLILHPFCFAFVAQWIVQASPKGKIGVRFPARAFSSFY